MVGSILPEYNGQFQRPAGSNSVIVGTRRFYPALRILVGYDDDEITGMFLPLRSAMILRAVYHGAPSSGLEY